MRFSRSTTSMRDQHILSYAEYLRADPGLWRITVEYMYSCSEVGKQRADEILLRVPLRLHEQTADSNTERIKTGDIVGVFKEVNQICFEYQREATRRSVCRASFLSCSMCFATIFDTRAIRLLPKTWYKRRSTVSLYRIAHLPKIGLVSAESLTGCSMNTLLTVSPRLARRILAQLAGFRPCAVCAICLGNSPITTGASSHISGRVCASPYVCCALCPFPST